MLEIDREQHDQRAREEQPRQEDGCRPEDVQCSRKTPSVTASTIG